MLVALYYIVGLILLYVATTGIYLTLIRFPKENDEIVIDHTSWHFKVAYPFIKYNDDMIHYMKDHGISKCAYFRKLFWMTWVGWPYLFLQESVKFILYNVVIFLPLGYLSLPDFEKMYYYATDFGFLWTRLKKIPLQRFFGIRILPIYVLAPLIYWACWHFYPKMAWRFTLIILIALTNIILWILIILVATALKEKTKKTETGTLAAEWIKIKKRRFCPIVPVK